MAATRYPLHEGVPEALRALDAVYVLGVGGPEDEAGIGHVERFVWRCAVVVRAGANGNLNDGGKAGSTADVAFAFSRMPRLMAFTRALNGRQPFTVPTEAMKLRGTELGAAPVELWLDATPEDFQALRAAGGTLQERRLPTLEGGDEA